MQKRHSNHTQYFEEQSKAIRTYVVPFISSYLSLSSEMTVAEIGCGAGGNMLPFLEMGCNVWGIDISPAIIERAKSLYAAIPESKKLTLIASDIYNVDPTTLPKFDLIVMRDVLEHIHNQEQFMKHLCNFVKPSGIIFMAFPPFRMPFGGHQQLCSNRLASRLPYFHLLPKKMYRLLLRWFGENDGTINGLLEIKDTRMHLHQFHKIVKKAGLTLVQEQNYLINPNYQVKFGLRPRRLPKVMNIPWFRDFVTTTCYAVLKIDDKTINGNS